MKFWSISVVFRTGSEQLPVFFVFFLFFFDLVASVGSIFGPKTPSTSGLNPFIGKLFKWIKEWLVGKIESALEFVTAGLTDIDNVMTQLDDLVTQKRVHSTSSLTSPPLCRPTG